MRTLLAQKDEAVAPYLPGLVGYWKMNEGHGTVVTDKLSIGFDYDNSIMLHLYNDTLSSLSSNGLPIVLSNVNYNDGNWHHIALNVHRGISAVVYIDGKAVKTLAEQQLPAPAGDYLYVGSILKLNPENQMLEEGRHFTGDILFLLLMMTSWSSHAASDVVVGGVVYHWSNQELGYIVTGWDEETPIQSLHICGTVDGMDVVGIQSGAFQDNASILYVKIDEGITRIGENAFAGCENMKCAVLPDEPVLTSVEQIHADDDMIMYYDLLGNHRPVPFNGFNIVMIRKGGQTQVLKSMIYHP